VIFPGFVDRVYLDAPSELQLDNGLGDVITIKNTKYELEVHLIFLFCHPMISLVSLAYSYILHCCPFDPCSWSDTVLWNPHLQMEACYKDFVCVENAQVLKYYLLVI